MDFIVNCEKKKGLNFMEAVKERCLGKCIVSEDDKYKMEGLGANIEIYDLEVSEFKKLNKYIVELSWKIYEKEKKTLSDKIDDVNFIANPKLDVGLVKKALNDFIYQYLLFGWKDLCPHNKENVKKKAKEIFGEKLIE